MHLNVIIANNLASHDRLCVPEKDYLQYIPEFFPTQFHFVLHARNNLFATICLYLLVNLSSPDI
jgi:hypothetical protein